jgi:hypothetical protein
MVRRSPTQDNKISIRDSAVDTTHPSGFVRLRNDSNLHRVPNVVAHARLRTAQVARCLDRIEHIRNAAWQHSESRGGTCSHLENGTGSSIARVDSSEKCPGANLNGAEVALDELQVAEHLRFTLIRDPAPLERVDVRVKARPPSSVDADHPQLRKAVRKQAPQKPVPARHVVDRRHWPAAVALFVGTVPRVDLIADNQGSFHRLNQLFHTKVLLLGHTYLIDDVDKLGRVRAPCTEVGSEPESEVEGQPADKCVGAECCSTAREQLELFHSPRWWPTAISPMSMLLPNNMLQPPLVGTAVGAADSTPVQRGATISPMPSSTSTSNDRIEVLGIR